jgi:hypothetical protein
MCIISFYPFSTFHFLLFRFISHTVDVPYYTLHTYKIGYIPFLCSVDTYEHGEIGQLIEYCAVQDDDGGDPLSLIGTFQCPLSQHHNITTDVLRDAFTYILLII